MANIKTIKFDPEILAEEIKNNCPSISFAFLYGSAKSGEIREGSDIDIAIYTDDNFIAEHLLLATNSIHHLFPDADVVVDISILNTADPIISFEALSGRLLFVRKSEPYFDFFVKTCKTYEIQMKSFERQFLYREEARNA